MLLYVTSDAFKRMTFTSMIIIQQPPGGLRLERSSSANQVNLTERVNIGKILLSYYWRLEIKEQRKLNCLTDILNQRDAQD